MIEDIRGDGGDAGGEMRGLTGLAGMSVLLFLSKS